MCCSTFHALLSLPYCLFLYLRFLHITLAMHVASTCLTLLTNVVYVLTLPLHSEFSFFMHASFQLPSLSLFSR